MSHWLAIEYQLFTATAHVLLQCGEAKLLVARQGEGRP